MAAAKKQKTRPTLSITKGDQIFAEKAHPLGQLLEIGGKTDRLPVTAHQLAAWCAGPDPGQLGIGFGNLKSVGAFHCFITCNSKLALAQAGTDATAPRSGRAGRCSRLASPQGTNTFSQTRTRTCGTWTTILRGAAFCRLAPSSAGSPTARLR